MILNTLFRFAMISLLTAVLMILSFAQTTKSKKTNRLQKTTQSVRFTAGKKALKIPFDLSNNLILFPIQVNDSKPFWFIFDTGASATILNSRLVKELNLKTQGKTKGIATGGAIEVQLVPRISLAASGVKVSNLTVAAIPLDDFSTLFGQDIGGIIGDDFIEKFVAEVDYANKIINLYAPNSYQYKGTGDIVPVSFINKKPFVNARLTPKGLDDIEGKFMIDTGADVALALNSPFVQKHQLLKSVSETMKGNLGGAGGLAGSVTGRFENIKIGRFVLNNPLVSLSQGTKGSDADSQYGGVLGGEIFRRFKLIIDYSRRRIIFEPTARLEAPFELDMSGIELIAEGKELKTFVVSEVLENSPASEAGIKEKDELIEINGQSVNEFTLEQIRQMFRQEGKEYLLTIKRGEKNLQFKIKLRRLI